MAKNLLSDMSWWAENADGSGPTPPSFYDDTEHSFIVPSLAGFKTILYIGPAPEAGDTLDFTIHAAPAAVDVWSDWGNLQSYFVGQTAHYAVDPVHVAQYGLRITFGIGCDPGPLDVEVLLADMLVANDDTANTEYSTPVGINVLINDTLNDTPVQLADLIGPPTVDTQPTNGTVEVLLDGSITYTPVAGFCGVDTFEYEIETPSGVVSSATVTVTIACCQVVANDDAATLTAPGVAINDVRANDDTCPPEVSTLSANTPVPSELSFNTSTGQVDLLAGAAAGVYSFDYELATANSSDVATVTVTYQPPPPEECYPPVCGCTVPYCGGG